MCKDLSGVHVAAGIDFHEDALAFERCFGEDARFLHHHNHDHNCSGTCVKNVKDKTKEDLAKTLKGNRVQPCRFKFYHEYQVSRGDKVVKVRRRGKDIVGEPFIVSSAARNQLGSVALERPHPFRSASTDCGCACLRCNNDFRFIVKGFPESNSLDEAFRCRPSRLAAMFQCRRAALMVMKEHKAVRRMAMSVVALHVAAKQIDYYIIKYAAKPMEQLQNLVTQYALGLRRLEQEEALEDARKKSDTDYKPRAKRVMLRLQFSANKAKWVSSIETAIYVHTEQQHFSSHNEVPMFTSRPFFLICDCKRFLSSGKKMLTRTAPSG